LLRAWKWAMQFSPRIITSSLGKWACESESI
jgi:hypothetical protein